MSSLNKVSSFNNFHICLLSHLRVKFEGRSGLDDSVRHIPVSMQLCLSLCTDRNSPVKATSKCWHVLRQAKTSELFRNIKLCDEPLLSTLRLQLRTDWTLPRITLRKTGNSTKHSKLSTQNNFESAKRRTQENCSAGDLHKLSTSNKL